MKPIIYFSLIQTLPNATVLQELDSFLPIMLKEENKKMMIIITVFLFKSFKDGF